MAKEGKRKFDLDKSSNHNFEIKKGSKRKFDLTKDSDDAKISATPKVQENIPPTSHSGNPIASGGDNNKKTNKWLFVVAIVVLVLLAWWLFPKSDDDKEDIATKTTEVVAPEDSAIITEANGEGQKDEPIVQSEKVEMAENSKSSEELPANGKKTDEQQKEVAKEEPATSKSASQDGKELVSAKHTPDETKKTSSTPQVDNMSLGDTEEMAKLVIRGQYGVGSERKQKLGSKYDVIQSRVNEMYKQGLVR